VRAVSAGTYFSPFFPPAEMSIGDPQVQIFPMSFSTGPKAVGPTVVDGRVPEGAHEILVNPLLARRMHLSLGAIVEVRVATSEGAVTSYPFRLVGTGVLPVGDGRPEVGSAMTLDGLRRMAPGATAQMLFLDLADNVSGDSVLGDLKMPFTADYLGSSVGVEQLLGINVARTRQAPIVLALVLGIMAAGVLGHLSVSAVRARTREIAVTRALGFDSHQVRRAMASMLMILSGGALAIALPLGVLAGRATFAVYADRLGVLPEPAVATWELVCLLPALLVIAYLVSLWPGWRASKIATAQALRLE
jgi:hypothetical protein